MFDNETIIQNRKSPSYVLLVIDSEKKSAIVVDSSNSSMIGSKVTYKKEENYSIFKPTSKEQNLKAIKYRMFSNTNRKEKIKSYI